jgi:hypothetical protein
MGLLGAPVAWTLQLVVGYGAEEADCSRGTAASFGGAHGVAVWISVAAGVAALASLAAAGFVWRATQRGAVDPRGRVQFMAVAGLLVGALFLALIVLTAVGTTHFEPCVSG